jgi:hypothetical protein
VSSVQGQNGSASIAIAPDWTRAGFVPLAIDDEISEIEAPDARQDVTVLGQVASPRRT